MSDVPIVEVVEAIERTALSPSPASVVADIELAISLAKQIKELAARHPSIAEIIKWIF